MPYGATECSSAIATAYDDGWPAQLSLVDFLAADALFADTHNGESISADHGGPVRLVVPRLYAWKSAKWVCRISLVANDQPGYWEQAVDRNHGAPWTVDGSHPDGESFSAPRSAVARVRLVNLDFVEVS